jgi:hypothetical protein
MKFFLKKIYYSIFSKNYNFTKTLINKYFLNKKKHLLLSQVLEVAPNIFNLKNFMILQKNITEFLSGTLVDLGLIILI